MRLAWLVVLWVLGCAAARPVATPVAARAAPAAAPVAAPVAESGKREAPPCTASQSELDRLSPKSDASIGAADHVTLRRGACFGACPVYSVTLFGDGRVTAVGERHVALQGAQAWTIAPELARRVLSEFARVDAFTRKATMIGHISDLPTATLVVSIGKRHAELSHYGAGFELELRLGGKDNEVLTRLERLVDQATETESRVQGCATER